MKAKFKNWVLPMFLGAALAIGGNALWESGKGRARKDAATQAAPPSENLSPLKVREAYFGTTLTQSRSTLRWERLPSAEDAANRGTHIDAHSSNVYRFREAIRLVGEFSDKPDDIKWILANAASSREHMILGNAGRAIAAIANRVAAKRGEKVTVDPSLLAMWDPQIETVGFYFIDVFVRQNPSGYLATLNDWLSWLTHDEQLPATIAFEKPRLGIPTRVLVSLNIIAAMEHCGDNHYEKVAADKLAKLTARYANDAGFPEMLIRLTGIRKSEERRKKSKREGDDLRPRYEETGK